MQANWSLILNLLLLIGVCVAIMHIMRGQKKNKRTKPHQPSIGKTIIDDQDDIIAVRKIITESTDEHKPQPKISAVAKNTEKPAIEPGTDSLMVFLLAKENRQLAGYELLQTVLAAGLRFGDGHLFHRHQHPNGQGPVLCSLAAATPSGVFDLQNIGAFSVRGLCLFMQASGNPTIDGERFDIMLKTARQLSEDLGTHLLDDQQQPLTDSSLQQYYKRLNLTEQSEQFA